MSGAPLFELRFTALARTGRDYSFRCDDQGRVDMDRLSPRGKTNYLYARAMVGHEFGVPQVVRVDGVQLQPGPVDA